MARGNRIETQKMTMLISQDVAVQAALVAISVTASGVVFSAGITGEVIDFASTIAKTIITVPIDVDGTIVHRSI